MYDNSFEKFPGETPNTPTEDELRAEQWQNAMSEGAPEFAGDAGVPSEAPISSAEAPITDVAIENAEESQDNQGLSNASAIINYGLNAAAKEYGVENVVQKIKSFDTSNSEHPIKDLFQYLGVDTPEEANDVRMEREAVKAAEADFYQNSEAAPTTKNRSPEGAFKAIDDVKELISEVEGADPRYEKLREEARAAGKGYFEYAVGSSTGRDLTDLFNALAAEPKSEAPTATETPESSTTPDNPNNSNTPDTPDRPTLNPEILA